MRRQERRYRTKVVADIFGEVIATERKRTISTNLVPTVVVEINQGSTDFAVNQIKPEMSNYYA